MSLLSLQSNLVNIIEQACVDAYGERPHTLALRYPPRVEFGDFSYECFPLAEQFRQDPKRIASNIASLVQHGNWFESAIAVGPYINFKIRNEVLFGDVCAEIIHQGDRYGDTDFGQGTRVMVEYLSPNTNKPLHLGHIRNGVLGMAISNLLHATGHTVIKANLVNDRGVHICKSMLAWQKWADGATPTSTGIKGDHFVGQWYVRYDKEEVNNPYLKDEVQEMLRQWEAGDLATLNLWKMMNGWVYDGFSQTYNRLGSEFDVFYYESNTYTLGKDLVQEGLDKGVFTRSDNNSIVANLPVEEFGQDKNEQPKKYTVLRPDGTSVYMTQDLGTAKMKFDEHNLNRSIYVVGSEQDYHFQCLFAILKMLGFEWATGCYHLSYGMVNLPEGKMKSREGKVVDADDLIEQMRQLAEQEIKVRDLGHELSIEEIQQRSLAIALGAIKFYLLRVRPDVQINFDPKESISFEGFTGPYCQYSYARSMSILRNAEDLEILTSKPNFSLLGNEEERQLIRALVQFPEEVEGAARELSPARACNHVFKIAQTFNQFYHKHPVLAAASPELAHARLVLVQATAAVLRRGLMLLGIEALRQM